MTWYVKMIANLQTKVCEPPDKANNQGRGIYSLFTSPPFCRITSFQSRSTSAISQFAE